MVQEQRPNTREAAKARVEARLGYQLPSTASLPSLTLPNGTTGPKKHVSSVPEMHKSSHSRVAAEGAFSRVAALMTAKSAPNAPVKESQMGRPYLVPMHLRTGNSSTQEVSLRGSHTARKPRPIDNPARS